MGTSEVQWDGYWLKPLTRSAVPEHMYGYLREGLVTSSPLRKDAGPFTG